MPADILAIEKLTADDPHVQVLGPFFDAWMNGDNGLVYTPKGLAYSSTARSVPNAANAAFLGLAHGRSLIGTPRSCSPGSMLCSDLRLELFGFFAEAIHQSNMSSSYQYS